MKKLFPILLLSVFFFTLALKPFDAFGKDYTKLSEPAITLKMQERKLWVDHVLWTRNFIISDLADLQDKDTVLQRLLKNQDDIGASIKPYYGEAAGNELSSILKEHILLAGQVVSAAKTGNQIDLEKYNKLWHENADKIATFLSTANPNWSDSVLKEMLYKHLQLLTDQVLARLNRDWKADIEAYDKGQDHMIMFSDVLSDGIIKQFPNKFK